MKQLFTAFKAFFLILGGKGDTVQTLLPSTPENETNQNKNDSDLVKYNFSSNDVLFNNGALYMLHLLQREGRLIDFLQEDLSNFDDTQVGAAVRLIHQNCSDVLTEYMTIEKIVKDVNEGANITISENEISSNLYKLSGSVPNKAPYEGILEHQGWHATEINLPQINNAFDCSVLKAADVNCQ
ncbi:DUF2760 domain-containing protein [Lentisphaerota bacterium WC36G]|nr:DUF2760 domain-containing protein [Lentisphaerae bacterium WC36]